VPAPREADRRAPGRSHGLSRALTEPRRLRLRTVCARRARPLVPETTRRARPARSGVRCPSRHQESGSDRLGCRRRRAHLGLPSGLDLKVGDFVSRAGASLDETTESGCMHRPNGMIRAVIVRRRDPAADEGKPGFAAARRPRRTRRPGRRRRRPRTRRSWQAHATVHQRGPTPNAAIPYPSW
jgi:hypothetical protein